MVPDSVIEWHTVIKDLTGFAKDALFMAGIRHEEVERINMEILLERLAEARGAVLTRHRADLIGLCPFHDDREPSLVITPEKNLWRCLRACLTGGSAIDWTTRA